MRRKIISLSLIFAILLLWCFIVFGDKGIIRIIQLRRERDRIIAEVNRLQEENNRLNEEIKRLREDPRYLESVARRDLGLVKDNEILFIFEGDNKANTHTEQKNPSRDARRYGAQ